MPATVFRGHSWCTAEARRGCIDSAPEVGPGSRPGAGQTGEPDRGGNAVRMRAQGPTCTPDTTHALLGVGGQKEGRGGALVGGTRLPPSRPSHSFPLPSLPAPCLVPLLSRRPAALAACREPRSASRSRDPRQPSGSGFPLSPQSRPTTPNTRRRVPGREAGWPSRTARSRGAPSEGDGCCLLAGCWLLLAAGRRLLLAAGWLLAALGRAYPSQNPATAWPQPSRSFARV